MAHSGVMTCFQSSVDVEAQEASQSDMAVDTVSSANDSEDEPVKNGDVKGTL